MIYKITIEIDLCNYFTALTSLFPHLRSSILIKIGSYLCFWQIIFPCLMQHWWASYDQRDAKKFDGRCGQDIAALKLILRTCKYAHLQRVEENIWAVPSTEPRYTLRVWARQAACHSSLSVCGLVVLSSFLMCLGIVCNNLTILWVECGESPCGLVVPCSVQL